MLQDTISLWAEPVPIVQPVLLKAHDSVVFFNNNPTDYGDATHGTVAPWDLYLYPITDGKGYKF